MIAINGVYNAIFIIFLMLILVAVDYMYSISDQIVNAINVYTHGNTVSDQAFLYYGKVRSIIYGSITGILVPFLVFLSFASSFINRNQDLGTYLVSAFAIVLITPLCIYIFSEIITNMLNVTILDTAYMATVWFQNMLWILVANMLLTLMSFVFIIKGGMRV